MSINYGSYLPTDVARAQGHARILEALAVAYRRGLPIPAGIDRAKAVRDALDEITSNATELPAPELPDKPSAIPAAIEKVAAARARHQHAQQVAAELRPLAVERFVGEIRDAMTAWVRPVVDSFDEHLQAFRDVERTAPHVTADQLASLDPALFAAWQDAQSSAFALEADVEDRRALAAAFGEDFTSAVFGDLLALVAVVAPPTGSKTDALTRDARERVPLLQEISKGAPKPYMTAGAGEPPMEGVGRWRALLAAECRGWLRLALADTGEAVARLCLADAWANLVPHITADSQNRGGSLTLDLLNRAAAAHRSLEPVAATA